MNIKDYLEYRETGKKLVYKILDSNKREDMIFAGKFLGFWDGHAMVFDKDEESNVLMEFAIFEKNRHGKRLVDIFYDSDITLNDIEEELLQGQVECYSSLFEIVNIDGSRYEIKLADLLNNEYPDFTLMDIGLSRTAQTGSLIYTRLIPVKDIHMTSGVSFAFLPGVKDRLLNDISNEKFRKRRKLNSADMFLLMFRKSNIYGIDVITV
jgi:hypothetical protein